MLTKKSKLSVALGLALAGASVAFSPQASAVNVAEDGLGEVALFQYYTARGGWQTFIRLINTSDDMVPVKVRFRRAADSEDVLDFVVALSPRDMWVAWTDDNVDGQGNAGVVTFDTSCLSPAPARNNLSGWVSTPGTDRKYVTFKADGADEGHVEVISLGRTGPLLNTIGTSLYTDTLHNPATNAPLCNVFGSAFTPGAGTFQSYLATSLQFLEPNNVLKANGYLVNAETGQGGGFDPVMLANFFNPIQIDDSIPALLGELFTAPDDFNYPEDIGSPLIAALFDETAPDLNYAWPRVSQVEVDTPLSLLGLVEDFLLDPADFEFQIPGPTMIIDEWDRGIDAVSAALTRRSVINEWAARETPESPGVLANETEWVVTFPTRYPPSKNYYFPYTDDGVPVIAPFTEGATPIHTALWDREEQTANCVSGIGQDTACQPNNALPYEVNVVTFRADSRIAFEGNRLDSQVATNVPEAIMSFPFNFESGVVEEWQGWMEMSFTGEQANAGLGSDLRANQVYDNLELTYNLGETITLRPALGQPGQEYCLFQLQTQNNPVQPVNGICPGIDPESICLNGEQVFPVNPGGTVGVIQFELDEDPPRPGGPLVTDFEPIDDNASGRLSNSLLLTGTYARPYMAAVGPNTDAEFSQDPACFTPPTPDDPNTTPEDESAPGVGGTNPVFKVPTLLRYKGVPVVGFSLNAYNLGSADVNHSAIVEHGYKRDVRLTTDDNPDSVLPDVNLVPANYNFNEPGWRTLGGPNS